jgi:hypothetical protein
MTGWNEDNFLEKIIPLPGWRFGAAPCLEAAAFRVTLGAGTPRERRNRQEGPVSAFVRLQIALLALQEAAASSERASGCSSNWSEAGYRRRGWNRRRRNFGGYTTGHRLLDLGTQEE